MVTIIEGNKDSTKSVIDRLLEIRGIKTSEERENFLNPLGITLMHPNAFTEMSKATERICKAIDEKENILIYGDFDAGNINIDNCTFRKADLDADAGNIEIDESDIKILKINTDAGNIEVSETSFDEVEVKTDFGNVEIHDVDDLDSYSIECKVDAGIVQVGNASLGRKYSSNGSGTGSIKVSVDAGNIEID